jgi:hypothetical protein
VEVPDKPPATIWLVCVLPRFLPSPLSRLGTKRQTSTNVVAFNEATKWGRKEGKMMRGDLNTSGMPAAQASTQASGIHTCESSHIRRSARYIAVLWDYEICRIISYYIISYAGSYHTPYHSMVPDVDGWS